MMHHWPQGTQGTTSFSMTKVVDDDDDQHSSAETEAIKESQVVLEELQVLFSFSFNFTDHCNTIYISFLSSIRLSIVHSPDITVHCSLAISSLSASCCILFDMFYIWKD